MATKQDNITRLKQEICNLTIENEYQRYEKKLDGHLRHWLTHSQLVKMSTAYLCALVKNISLVAVSADDRLDDILLICQIIDSRREEKDRKYAIEYIKDIVSAKHPYGFEFRDRIRECISWTELNI